MRVYHGWFVVVGSMLIMMLTIGTASNAFGLFVLPVSHDFGMSRADTNTGMILLNFGMAFAAPLMGRLLDRGAIRRTLMACATLLAVSLVMLGLSHNLWFSAFVLAVPLAVALVAIGTLGSTALIARWFVARRGRAMAITAMGLSLSSVVMVPAIGLLMQAIGWRHSLMVWGSGTIVVTFGILLFVRERPGPEDREIAPADTSPDRGEPSAASPGDGRLTTAQLLRMRQFWLIACGTALGFGVVQGVVISLVPFAQAEGHSIAEAAGLFSVFGVCGVTGKIMLAWLADRVDRAKLLATLFCLVASTNAMLLAQHGYAWLMGCSAVLGLAAGATTPVYTALLADRFGAASFGTAYGSATFITSLVAAGCVRFGGEVFDRTGNYDGMFICFVGLSLAGAAAVFAGGRAPGDAASRRCPPRFEPDGVVVPLPAGAPHARDRADH